MAWEQLSYLPRSLMSTAESSHIPMEEKMYPHCEYSLKRTSTNLIQSWGRTVLLGETCSQLALLHYVPLLPERKHLVECCQAWNISKQEEPPLKSLLPQPTRTWYCICREPICKWCYGWRRTSRTVQMYNWMIMDGKWRNMSTWCLPFLWSRCTIDTHGRHQVQLQSGWQSL